MPTWDVTITGAKVDASATVLDAADVGIADSGALYTATNVEAALAEVKAIADAAGGGGGVPTGYYAFSANHYGVPGHGFTARTGRGFVADRMFYEPMLVNAEIEITEIAVQVTTLAASSNIRLGIYSADVQWQPVTLIVDFGAIDSGSTGKKGFTGLTQALPAGRYVTALISNGAPTCTAGASVGWSMDFADQAKRVPHGYGSGTYGALPATPVAAATAEGSDVSSLHCAGYRWTV